MSQSVANRGIMMITNQCPIRHIVYFATATTNSESKHEDHHLRSPIQGSREQEIVFPEPTRSVFAKVVLREYCQTERCEHGTIDTDAEVSKGPWRNVVKIRDAIDGVLGAYSRE